MTKKITKAVIPAAGLGTRMLPIARTVPKEVLPIVDRPVIEYLVKEAVASGITDILIITNRGKEAMESYFDHSPEYEEKLIAKGKTKELEDIANTVNGANIMFMRQKEAKGLGHAVRCAKSFTGDDPFVVLYGDDMIDAKTPVCRQLMNVYEKYGLGVVGVKPVPTELVYKYCSLGVTPLDEEKKEYKVFDMIEKPKPEEVLSNLSILGRVLLTPEIYDILDNTKPGAGNEIQLTDAMCTMAKTTGMTALEFEGTRYDMGSKLGFLKANCEFALKHPDLKDDFRSYLLELVKTL